MRLDPQDCTSWGNLSAWSNPHHAELATILSADDPFYFTLSPEEFVAHRERVTDFIEKLVATAASISSAERGRPPRDRDDD